MAIRQRTSVDRARSCSQKILVVEDNKALQLYMKVLFAKEYEVIEATNGQEGIDMAIEQMPNIILCDIMMPVKDGFDCCRELKEDMRTCHIPIIFLTSKGMEADKLNALDLGADDYLQKPVSSDLLKAKVTNMIKSRENLKQIYMNQFISPPHNEALNTSFGDEFMKHVIDLIETHMHEVDFSVFALAQQLNMSQSTLYRRVKQFTEFNIAELIRGVRLRRAAELLRTENISIQEIVEQVGYNDAATFRKHFTKLFEMPPSLYAKNNREAK